MQAAIEARAREPMAARASDYRDEGLVQVRRVLLPRHNNKVVAVVSCYSLSILLSNFHINLFLQTYIKINSLLFNKLNQTFI